MKVGIAIAAVVLAWLGLWLSDTGILVWSDRCPLIRTVGS